jgi:hypothetical protein
MESARRTDHLAAQWIAEYAVLDSGSSRAGSGDEAPPWSVLTVCVKIR